MTTKQQVSGGRQWMRWIARGLGLVWSLFLLILFVGEGPGDAISLDYVLLAILLGLTVAGFAFAWWRERIGGTITALGGLLLGIISYTIARRNKLTVALMMGLPFLAVGLLLLACQWKRENG